MLPALLSLTLVLSSAFLTPARANTPLAPELGGLGSLRVPVTTPVPAAQRFFDQGVKLLYAFNHAEALRAFREAARLDPDLAMAYWGQAMTLAPNLNAPLTPDNARKAYEAVQRALTLRARASAREQALIEALAARFAADGVGDRAVLDRAYADAMRGVAARHSTDPDIQTFYADAVMNTMPWDYWQKDGSAKPDTALVIAAIEGVIARHPDHPGAHHYYIHVLEASNDPDRAVASADRLGSLMPAAGHMVHMPAHIYIRVGRYADAAEANVRAIAADEDYLAQCQAQGLYPVTYYPHNLHFLWAAATLEGRGAAAVDAARQVAAKVPHHHAGALSWTIDFPVTPLLSYARFGRWQEILTEPMPPANAPYAVGIWHYARALALIAGDRLDRAAVELSALEATLAHDAFKTTFKDTPLLPNLRIAAAVVQGELSARQGRIDAAIESLKAAVAIDDAFPYAEPPLWHQPPRQVLGAVLLEAGRAREAEAVYLQDLERFRENGWSLFGLARSLAAQGRRDEAAAAERRFRQAWKRADVALSSSRVMTPKPQSIALPAGATLEYVEQGDPSGLPVVLLHGYTDSWRSFATLLPHLPSGWRVIAVTQRGHGDSSRPMSGYTSADFAGDVAALLDALQIPRAVILGHSMGSTVALRLAIERPERVLALVLEGAFMPRPANPAVREFLESVVKLTDPIDPAFVREFQESTLAQPVPAAFLDMIVREGLKVPARVWQAALTPYLDLDLSKEITAITVPTLLVWGDQDGFTKRDEQDALKAAIAGSKLVVYAGAGHSPHWEEPARVAGTISTFIDRHVGDRGGR